jgi:rhodanese-related sulfurtransferase
MKTVLKGLLTATMLSVLFMLSGGAPSTVLADEPPDALEAIRYAAEAYYDDGYRQYHINADTLFDLLHDGDTNNDPRVISVQTRAEYELGHIPGAINVPWDEITDIAQVQAHIHRDKTAVIYCNHAVHSAQISAILNLLGYNTLDLAYGFESWTQSQTAIPDHFDPDCVCEHTIDTKVYTAEPTFRYPQIGLSGDNPEALVTAAANAYLASNRDSDATICPCDLEKQLLDGYPGNDPFVLSLQWPEDYAVGHIPQAVNIPRWELFRPDNLSRLPTDRPIVICCYLGFTSSQVAAILNMMGYDTQVSLHGLSGWTLDPEIARFRIDDPQNWRDYPIEGTAAGPQSPMMPAVDSTLAPTILPVTGELRMLWLLLTGLGLVSVVAGSVIRQQL